MKSDVHTPLSALWTIDKALEVYQVPRWGQGYFGINESGHVVVRPSTTSDTEIDLFEVVEGLRARDLNPPILLRFSDILAHRLGHLYRAFRDAIAENDYRGGYIPVYPIKVNQQRQVVEQVLRFGESYGLGLEAGSKPELLAALGLTASYPARLIICNGFKDDDFVKAVVLATKLGRKIIPVVENYDELRRILKHSEEFQVRPLLGVRVKLSTTGRGHWETSLGAKAKFGLSIAQLLEMFNMLIARGMEDCLKLVHCHPGSQIEDIHTVKDVIDELAQVYTELVRMGAGIEFLDVGGGLGVEYAGSQQISASSMNYSLQEYTRDVVYRIANICAQKDVRHPTIVTESGRAMVAHHSLLVFNVLGAFSVDNGALPFRPVGNEEKSDLPRPIMDLLDAHAAVSDETLVECYHDAVRGREQAMEAFKLGYMTLPQRALAEQVFWGTCVKIQQHSQRRAVETDDLADLETALCDTYFCNLSIFQSLPDSWAIGQLFPIMPLHRLNEAPTRQAVLADITCDSDGRVDSFSVDDSTRPNLPLHPLEPKRDYYLAAFLVGAYQETLGDLHNLFGDTHVVHIKTAGGDWRIEEIVKGDTAGDVLRYTQYEVERLQPRLAQECEQAVRERKLTLAESRALLRFYDNGLNGYTYLEVDFGEE